MQLPSSSPSIVTIKPNEYISMNSKIEINTTVQEAMEFPLQCVITRYGRDHNLSYQDAERHVFELRRFLALCALNSAQPYGMRGQIDEAWHTFIMFTRDYADFCRRVAGRFIHHQPDTDAEERSSSSSGYERFLADYETIFGEPAPADLWPRPFVRNSAAEGCGGCNGCGVDMRGRDSLHVEAGCGGCNGCQSGGCVQG